MKILLVSTQDYIHHPVPSRHHYIFEELAKRHEIHVPHFHVSEGPERATSLIVHEATRYKTKSPLAHYVLNAPTHFRILDQIVKDNGIDVIVASNVLAGTAAIHAAKKNDIPVLFDLKDWFPDSAAAYYKNSVARKIIHDAVLAITRYNLDNSDKITTVSPSLARKLGTLGYDASIITNGVDIDTFVPMNGMRMRRELGINENGFVIGFEGSIERWYALDQVIDALPEIIKHRPDTTFLIVGGSLFTDYMTELKAKAAKVASGHVIFTGAVPYNELPGYISAMDVGIMPLLPPQWVDIALPNKFFEYSACGKPILSSPIPDVMDIGGPHLSVYYSRDEFIEGIKNIIDSPQTYELDFSQYSWRKKAEEMEKLLFTLTA